MSDFVQPLWEPKWANHYRDYQVRVHVWPDGSQEWRAARFYIEGDRIYRMSLRRCWDPALPEVLFIGLNPSLADANKDDKTVQLWRGFSKRWGFGGFVACNAYNLVAQNPRNLLTAPVKIADPVVWRNTLFHEAQEAGLTVACWGAHCAEHHAKMLRRLLTEEAGVRVYAIGVTRYGTPRHPRGVSALAQPILLWDRVGEKEKGK